MNNVQIAQEIYQRFGQGNIPGVLELLDPEVDWIWYGPSSIPWAGSHRGREAMISFFTKIGKNVQVEAYEPREFLAGENGVVTVLGWQRVRVLATNKTWETHWCHVWIAKNGLMARVREYYDTVPMMAAFQP